MTVNAHSKNIPQWEQPQQMDSVLDRNFSWTAKERKVVWAEAIAREDLFPPTKFELNILSTEIKSACFTFCILTLNKNLLKWAKQHCMVKAIVYWWTSFPIKTKIEHNEWRNERRLCYLLHFDTVNVRQERHDVFFCDHFHRHPQRLKWRFTHCGVCIVHRLQEKKKPAMSKKS